MKKTTLDLLRVGEKAIIIKVNNKGDIRRRLLDIGLIPGTEVESILKSPSGDPAAFLIRGSLFAIRSEDASKIEIEVLG